jgi:hypothetical protein
MRRSLVLTNLAPLLNGLFSVESLVPLALAIIACYLLLRRRPRPARPQESDSIQREPPAASPKARLRRDLDELVVELQETSRRISAEIDMRFSKLDAVIQDADRRIAVLNRLTRQGADPSADVKHDAASGAADVRHAVVYELADAGASPLEIARELGKTPGEVELILNLRQRPRGKSADAAPARSPAKNG